VDWGLLNTDLSVHVLREPVGEWICLDAETTLGSGSVGMAVARVYDEGGLVARSAQALLVTRRPSR
jgi:acyl-CoA thioesterase